MILIKDDIFYIQRIDISYMESAKIPFSDNIKKIKEHNNIFDDEFTFVKISNQEDINSILNEDFLYNFSNIKDIPVEDLKKMSKKLSDKAILLSDIYLSLNSVERSNNMDIPNEINKLKLKYLMLIDIYRFKKGIVEYDFPKGVEYPEGTKKPQNKYLRLIMSLIK